MNNFSIKKKYWYQRNGLLQCSPFVAWYCVGFMSSEIESAVRGTDGEWVTWAKPQPSPTLTPVSLCPGESCSLAGMSTRDAGNSESSFSGFFSSMKPTINQNIEQNRKGK